MSDSSIRFTPLARDLPATVPFVGPEAQERVSGIKFRTRTGANESGFGPSPNAIAAMQEAVVETWKYGDPENHDLRVAIAEYHRVEPDNVMIGEGIDGLFGNLGSLFIEPGVQVVTSLGSYPTFNFHVAANGGDLHLVPYKYDKEDIPSLLKKVRDVDATLLYFSNPNNPMGTWWSANEMEQMIADLPEQTILVLDEAYIELAPDGVAPRIDVSNKQVLRFRTFSKAYGMAGARVGYVLGHSEIVTAFDKVRNHYGMNRTGQIGAEVALKDEAYLQEIRSKMAAGRERISQIARDAGLEPIASATNFVTIDCGRDSAYAKQILEKLLERGIFIRMPGVEPQARCIRVSVGLDHELDLFEKELKAVIEELS